MMERLVSDARHLAVLFCKYLGYIAIALTHTCYLLRHYAPPHKQAQQQAQQQQQQHLTANGSAVSVSVQQPRGYLPVDRVKGKAQESRY